MTETLAVKIHTVYCSTLIKSIRLVVTFFLAALIIYSLRSGIIPKYPLFFFNLLFMLEVFIHYALVKKLPLRTVADDKSSPLTMTTHAALTTYLSLRRDSEMPTLLLKNKAVQFLLAKAEITASELPTHEIKKEEVLAKAKEIVRLVSGTYITHMDIMAGYLLLTEQQTKLLFQKQLKEADVLEILHWTRMTFPFEEQPKKTRVQFMGDGIGEGLISGWTPETKNYTQDFTLQTLHEAPLVVGREKEYGLMSEALMKSDHNNVLLVGDIGVGKEMLVRALAYHSFIGNIDNKLRHKRVWELMAGMLIAGTTDRGNLEARLQDVIAELSHAGNIILYVPELQNLLGTATYNLNLSGALLPYLKDGSLPIIATMTPGNYKTYLETNPLREVFTIIQVNEPDNDQAVAMLFARTPALEEKHRVIFSYRSVRDSIKYANRYLTDAVLPESALKLLEDAAVRVSTANKGIVTAEDITEQIEEKSHVAVAAPKGEEKDLLLHLEEKLHTRVIGQDEGVKVIAEAMRRLRSGMASVERPISFLFLGPTGVGKTETAKALAALYYGSEEKMLRFDMSEYSDETGLKRLLGAAPGEGDERGELTDKIHDNPFSLVLLDEFEKAHPKIHNLFLQVLEDGRLTDNKGRTVSFLNTIIIATSNAASEFIREEVQSGKTVDKAFEQRLLEYLQKNHLLKPELLNRFDDVVTFIPLGETHLLQITKIMLESVAKTLTEQDITVHFDEKAIAKVAKEGADEQFGARPLRRYIQDNVEDLLAKKKLSDEIKRGSIVKFTVSENNELIVAVS